MSISRFPLVAAAALAAALLALAPHPAKAQTAAIGFTSGAVGAEDDAWDTFSPGYNLGFQFNVTTPITVTSLGYFNDPSYVVPTNQGYGLTSVYLTPPPTGSYTYSSDHPVGIYDLTGDLLASATVTSASTANGDFLYTDLTSPVNLGDGSYIIAGLTGLYDPYVYDVGDYTQPYPYVGITQGPGVQFVTNEYTVDSSGSTDQSALSTYNTFSNAVGDDAGFFGPNFLFQPQGNTPVVPESSSLALFGACGLALFGLLAFRRRLDRRKGASA